MSHSRFVPLGCTLANAAALHTLLVLFTDMDAPMADQTGLLVWWGCLCALWLGLDLFLRKERTEGSVLTLFIAACAVQFGVTLALGWRCASMLGWFAMLVLWAVSYWRLWSFLHAAPTPEQLMLTFETTAAALFLAAFFVTNSLMDAAALLHLAAATGLALAALAMQRCVAPRVGRGSNAGGKALPVVLLAGVGGIAALCAVCFTPSLHAAVRGVESALRGAGSALFRAFEAFMTFLASLLPEEDMTDMEFVDTGEGISLQGGSGEEEFLDLSALVYVLIAVVVVVVVVLLIHALRKSEKRGGKATLRRNAGQVRRKGGGLKELWRRLVASLRRRARYLRLRNTPMGLLVWLEGRFGRRAEESPRAFLARCAQARPDCAGELAELADWLDEYYFAPERPRSVLSVSQLRRKLKGK